MSDEKLDIALVFNRNDIKLQVRKRVIASRPEILSMVSNKIIHDAYIYTQGYVEAFKENVSEPYNSKEMMSFVYDRAYEYVVRRINEEQK